MPPWMEERGAERDRERRQREKKAGERRQREGPREKKEGGREKERERVLAGGMSEDTTRWISWCDTPASPHSVQHTTTAHKTTEHSHGTQTTAHSHSTHSHSTQSHCGCRWTALRMTHPGPNGQACMPPPLSHLLPRSSLRVVLSSLITLPYPSPLSSLALTLTSTPLPPHSALCPPAWPARTLPC